MRRQFTFASYLNAKKNKKENIQTQMKLVQIEVLDVSNMLRHVLVLALGQPKNNFVAFRQVDTH